MKERMRLSWACLGANAILWLFGLPASGQEWHRFRGPNGSGISSASTIPIQVAPADYQWRAELPGVGHSSPVIWGEKLFVTSAEEDKGRRHLHCIDTRSGKILWTRSYDFK